ncbi:phosphonate ABC transporter ATP-binding protein [Guggenheimella bovis]
MPFISVDHLSKEYVKGSKALTDITFDVEKGEFISIIGPSGAGKSTLLRCFNRMIDPTSGSITIDGMQVESLKKTELKQLRRQIGMIFQHYNLVNRLTVLENTLHGRLGYNSALRGMFGIYTKEEKEKAMSILDTLGLSDQMHKRCDRLSGGQKQRVGIARALVQEPKVILCDEPIASLDPSSARIIMDYLHNVNKKLGITCIFNLHQVDVAMKYSDRIIGINAGKILFDGSPKDLEPAMIHRIYGTDEGQLITD